MIDWWEFQIYDLVLISKMLAKLQYLLSWIKESAVGCLELALSKMDSIFSSDTLCKTSWFTWAESKWVDSVGAREELGISWILLHVFPAGVRPSAWNKLQVLLWDANLGLHCLWCISWSAWSHWPTASLISSTVIKNVVAIVFCLHFYFNFCILYY